MAVQGKWALNNVWTDGSGNGYTLTPVNTPTTIGGHGGGASNAFLFARASGEYAWIADASCPNLSFTGSCSFSFWTYLTTLPGAGNYYAAINKEDGLSAYDQHSYGIYSANPDNKIMFRLSGNGTSFTTLLSNITLGASAWYHIVCVYDQADGNSMKIYINGALACTPITGPASIFDGTSPFALGIAKDNGVHGLNGRLDDVILFDHALTLAEVQYYYSMGDNFSGGVYQFTAEQAVDEMAGQDAEFVNGTSTFTAEQAADLLDAYDATLTASGNADFAGEAVTDEMTAQDATFVNDGSLFNAEAVTDEFTAFDAEFAPSGTATFTGEQVIDEATAQDASFVVASGTLTGTLKDRIGNTINCSTYNVRINIYQVNNTVSAPLATLLCTASNGIWTINSGIVSGTKYLVTFEFLGTYTPLGEADIAVSQYMTAA